MNEEQQKFIKDLALKMKTQSNRATQYPLFVIQVKEKNYGDRAWCNEVERKSESDGVLCESCEKLQNENVELPDFCEDCDSECFVWFDWKETFDFRAGIFFTEEAISEHIKDNDYHYEDPKSYVICAWRNPEMQKIFEIIFALAGEEIPSQYK